MDLDEDLHPYPQGSCKILAGPCKVPAKILQDPEGSLKNLKDPLRS